jgi:hypothetical protein
LRSMSRNIRLCAPKKPRNVLLRQEKAAHAEVATHSGCGK